MNSRIVLTSMVMLLCLIINAQQHTISGYVVDKENKEPIIGANVFIAKTFNGTVTNNFGYFVINVPSDKDSITASFVGYTTVSLPLNLNNENYILELTSGHEIEEVNVLASKGRNNEVIKPLSISTKQIKLLPSVTGEADLMKAYQYLPGISRGAEGNNSIYVRGGSPDQNLILLDDVPLYYVNHIGGIVSIFDENAISNVEVYKSGFPARYGGRLSSVVDVRMKNGSLNKLGGEFSIGLISSKLHLNGPIIKDKISFMLTARKSMTDFYMQPLSHYTMGTDGFMKYSFYDINAKVNWIIDNKNRIYLSAYSGNDGSLMRAKFTSSDKEIRKDLNIDPYTFEAGIGNGWGNQLACFRWNHIYSQKLFSNLTLASTKYYYANQASNSILIKDTDDFTEKYGYDFNSGLNDNMAKLDFDYFINNQSHLKFGTSYTMHDFNTGELHNLYDINEEVLGDTSMLRGNLDSQIDTVYGAEQISSKEIVAYIEGKFELYDKLHVNAGLHCSAYLLSGESNYTIQPRLAMRYNLMDNITLTASYVRMVQNLHMLSGSDTSTPTDIWLPATKLAKSEYSDQVSFGYARESNNGIFKLNVEGFYKSMNNLIDYKLGYNLTSTAENWYDKIETNGKGWCYGLEILAEKVKGDLTGWIAYTLSKNMRQFEGINKNIPFQYVYDRPHDLSIVANYKLSNRITFSGTWEYSSGRRVTLGTAAYDNNTVYTHLDLPAHDPLVYNESEKYRHQFIDFRTETATIYGTKNNYRLPAFHKLNLSAHFTKKKKRGERTWVVGIQNVYNRMNAYNVYYTTNDDGTFELNKITLFPIMPNFSYNFKF